MVYGPICGFAPELAEVAQLVEQWSEEPCVASSILALGTEALFAGLFLSRVFGRAGVGDVKQMVRVLRYTLFQVRTATRWRSLARASSASTRSRSRPRVSSRTP